MVDAVLIMACGPIGIKLLFEEGMLMGWASAAIDRAVRRLPNWIAKPLWLCERCMVSLWGIPMALAYHYGPLWLDILILAVAALGLQHLLDR